jgi:hypothetical protein
LMRYYTQKTGHSLHIYEQKTQWNTYIYTFAWHTFQFY